jgi:hypothetical protein
LSGQYTGSDANPLKMFPAVSEIEHPDSTNLLRTTKRSTIMQIVWKKTKFRGLALLNTGTIAFSRATMY